MMHKMNVKGGNTKLKNQTGGRKLDLSGGQSYDFCPLEGGNGK